MLYQYQFILFIKLLFLIRLYDSKYAVFIIGDSISYRLYRYGLVPTFNCTIEDNFIYRPVEKISYNGVYGDYTDNKAWRAMMVDLCFIGDTWLNL